jgi:hypothetical protein
MALAVAGRAELLPGLLDRLDLLERPPSSWCDVAEVARLVRERHQDGDEAVAIRLRLGHRVLPLGEDGGVAFTA